MSERAERTAEGGLRFRAPGSELTLSELLGRAVPAATETQRAEAVRRGEVTVDARECRELSPLVAPGARIQVAGALCALVLPPANPPAGSSLRVLTTAPPWEAGELGSGEQRCHFRVGARRGAVAELVVEPLRRAVLDLAGVFDALAALGHPVLGDVWRDGIAAAGGLRVARGSEQGPSDWWPREPLLLGRAPRSGAPAVPLEISRESARMLRRGHPWVLADADCGDPWRYRPGALVRLEPRGGGAAGLALVDGEGRCVARRWSAGTSRSESVQARVRAAFERRAALFATEATDAFRLVHGEADGLPGLAIDRLGGVLRLLISGKAALSIAEPAREAAVHALRE